MCGASFCLSPRSSFQGAALVDRPERGDHICSNVFQAAEDSGDKSVDVDESACVCKSVCWKVTDSIYTADR